VYIETHPPLVGKALHWTLHLMVTKRKAQDQINVRQREEKYEELMT
jgi:hypothetical protein